MAYKAKRKTGYYANGGEVTQGNAGGSALTDMLGLLGENVLPMALNAFLPGIGGTVGGQITNFISNSMRNSYANGGFTKGMKAEIEDGEYVETPDGKLTLARGKKHSQGGIDTNLPEGSFVFPAHMKEEVKAAKGDAMAISRLKAKVELLKKYDIKQEVNENGIPTFRTGGGTEDVPFGTATPSKLGVPATTVLTPAQEIAYRKWMDDNGFSKWNDPSDPYTGKDYDYRGFWKEEGIKGLSPAGKNGVHFTDKYKLLNTQSANPEYTTLSEESKYASPFDRRGQGNWQGETYVNDSNVNNQAYRQAASDSLDRTLEEGKSNYLPNNAVDATDNAGVPLVIPPTLPNYNENPASLVNRVNAITPPPVAASTNSQLGLMADKGSVGGQSGSEGSSLPGNTINGEEPIPFRGAMAYLNKDGMRGADYAMMAGQALPAIYNVFQGLRPYDRVKAEEIGTQPAEAIKNLKYNITPQLQANNQMINTANFNIDQTTGSPQVARANKMNTLALGMNSSNQLYGQKNNVENQYIAQGNMLENQINQYNSQMRFNASNMEAQNKAQRDNIFGQGMSDVSGLVSQGLTDYNTMAMEQRGLGLLDKRYPAQGDIPANNVTGYYKLKRKKGN